MRHDNFIPQPQLTTIRSRGRLPHWQVDHATYFLTFRLQDSIPVEGVRALLLEREHMMRHTATAAERARLDESFSLRLDGYLDQGLGSCLLRNHGEVVADSLKHFDRARYELHAWCVMPNHVHAMIYLESGAELPKIVQAWKSYSAHRINLGPIWQREYFDRVVRSPQQFNDTRAYIRNNPAKAGLRDWPWVG